MRELDALQSLLGLRGLSGSQLGCMQLLKLSSLRSLHGLERVTSFGRCGSFRVKIRECSSLESLAGLISWGGASAADVDMYASVDTCLGLPNLIQPSEQCNISQCAACAQTTLSNIPVQCDYRFGRCHCPLGMVGNACDQHAPVVSVAGSQRFECDAPSAQGRESQQEATQIQPEFAVA